MTDLGIMKRARRILYSARRRVWNHEVKSRRATGAHFSKRANGAVQSNPQPIWIETEARVIDCRPELVRISELTLRITEHPNKLIISFTYYAHAQTYYDSFISPAACAHGDTFSVYYNALKPRQNTLSKSEPTKRGPRSAIAMLGAILISILVLSIVRG